MEKKMKTRILIVIVLFSFSGTTLSAQWFNGIGSVVSRIEQEPSGSIWLMRPTGENGTSINFQGCILNQVKLIPPPGREDSWLSMVIAAIMAKKSLNIYGDCDTTNNRINATRITVG